MKRTALKRRTGRRLLRVLDLDPLAKRVVFKRDGYRCVRCGFECVESIERVQAMIEPTMTLIVGVILVARAGVTSRHATMQSVDGDRPLPLSSRFDGARLHLRPDQRGELGFVSRPEHVPRDRPVPDPAREFGIDGARRA